MQFRADGFDIWVYRRKEDVVEYLLLRASEEKAKRWFGGSQFWQVPSHFVEERSVVDALRDELASLGLTPASIWAAEHTYTIYNRRYEDIVHHAVFAAEVRESEVTLGDGHSEYAWLPADEAAQRMVYRGLKEGLRSVCEFLTESESPALELRLA